MSWQDAFNFAAGFVLTVGGWVLRTIWDAVQELRKQLLEMEKMMPGTYARRDDMQNMFTQIMNMLRDIQKEVSGKADKD